MIPSLRNPIDCRANLLAGQLCNESLTKSTLHCLTLERGSFRSFEQQNVLIYCRPTENDGVACMHGPEECMGNIIELCAADLYPDPKIYLGFTMCLSKDYTDIPQRSLIEDCALEHSLDFGRLNECAAKDDGGYAMGMLRDSVRRSKDVCYASLWMDIF
jgi:hypothetical protein